MTQILFFISIAAMLVGTYLHVTGMQRFQAFGQSEGNPLWRDKYGFPSLGKYMLSLAVYFGVAVLIAWAIGNIWQVWIAIAIMAGGQFVFWMINEADAKKKRVTQTRILTELSRQAASGNTDPNSPEILSIMNPREGSKGINPTVSKAGRVWYRLFPWLHLPGTDQAATSAALREKIITWSQRTPGDWFNV